MPTGITSGGLSRPVQGAGWALGLLLAINLFNYIDRQILSATLPLIKNDAAIIDPDDEDPNSQLGFLTTAFMVAYMCLSPVFGRLGDKYPRWKLIGIAIIIWSLATGGTGLASGYLMLFLTRCLVGVGEAAYGPVAPAMLSDLYPVDHRGRIMSWFYMAIPVGSALGFVIGSLVSGLLGWREAFLVAVIPGLALGALCFVMKEPPRNPISKPGSAGETSQQPLPEASSSHYWDVLKELRLNKSFILCCAGMTASTFVLGGFGSVMQLYLFEREARFTLNSEGIDKLQNLKKPDGAPKIAEEIMAKLRAESSSAVMTIQELKTKLNGTKEKPGVLSKDEFKRSSFDIYDACTVRGSLSNGEIGIFLGGIVVVSGLIATLLGGIAGDYLRNRGYRGAYFKVSGWGMVVAFPFFLGMLFTSMPLGWAFLFIAVFFLFFNTGPANAILANVTRNKIRATAFAINILIIHALGDAISPAVLGKVADLFSWHTAFLATSFLMPISGLLWLWGASYLDEDTRTAEGVSKRL